MRKKFSQSFRKSTIAPLLKEITAYLEEWPKYYQLTMMSFSHLFNFTYERYQILMQF